MDTIRAADLLLEESPDNSASRSYYAAFHAVSALFLLEGRSFTSHKELWIAFHREMIRSGRWPQEFSDYLRELRADRETGDYGGAAHVSPQGAGEAYQAAMAILEAVNEERPNEFPLEIGGQEGAEE